MDFHDTADADMKRHEIDEVAEVKVTYNTRVRNRLEQLLGTDILRLNDRQYMRNLMRRIYEDQEQSLQSRADQRQAQEQKRLKSLVENRKMEKPPNMEESAFVVSFEETKAEMAIVQRRQFNKRHNIKKRKTVSCAELESDNETSPDAEDYDLTTNENLHQTTFISSTRDLPPEEDDSEEEEERARELAQLALKYGKYEEPLVHLLHQEGTVPKLYDLAEIILVKPPKPGKKKATEEQAAADESSSEYAQESGGTEEAEGELSDEGIEGLDPDAPPESEASAPAPAAEPAAAPAAEEVAPAPPADEAPAPADEAPAPPADEAPAPADEAPAPAPADEAPAPAPADEAPAPAPADEAPAPAPADEAPAPAPADESAAAPAEEAPAAEEGGAAEGAE